MALSLRLLGGFAVRDWSGRELALPTRKTRGLLAYLALHADKPQLRDRLTALLWSDREDRQARQSLSQALRSIRRLGEEAGVTVLDGDVERVTMNGDALESDVVRFGALLVDKPAEAVKLYEGPFLDGLSIPDPAFEEWLTATRTELHNRACDAMARAADVAVGVGKTQQGIDLTRRLIALDPLREEAHRRLMRLLYQSGDRAGALQQYQICAGILRKELQVEPAAATNELFKRIRTEIQESGSPSSPIYASRESKRSLIAILPFENMSNDADMDLLAHGLVEDIIAGLERFHVVSVVSRTSSSRYRDNRPNARVIGAELGAAYLMEGSVRKAGNFVRIAAQAIDATTDEHLWAQRYDRPLDNPFDLQDEVSSGIIAAIEPVLVDAELRKGRRAEPGFDQLSKAKQAVWLLYRFTKDNNAKAIELLNEIIAENPDLSGRHHALALGHMWDLTFGWSSDPLDSIRREVAAAERAVELAPNDAFNLAVLAWAYAFSGECGRAVANIDRAIEIHPASVVPHGVKAWIAGHCGNPETAIKSLEAAISRTTESPFIFNHLLGGALGHLALEQWEDAARLAETATVRRPNSLTGWVVQTVAHHNAGNEAEAARRFLNLVDLKPDMTERWLEPFLPIKPPDLKELILTGLRALGLPEA